MSDKLSLDTDKIYSFYAQYIKNHRTKLLTLAMGNTAQSREC